MNPDDAQNEPQNTGASDMPQAPMNGSGDQGAPMPEAPQMPAEGDAPEAPAAPEGGDMPAAPAPDEGDKGDGAKW